jgi:hypothetical protein
MRRGRLLSPYWRAFVPPYKILGFAQVGAVVMGVAKVGVRMSANIEVAIKPVQRISS